MRQLRSVSARRRPHLRGDFKAVCCLLLLGLSLAACPGKLRDPLRFVSGGGGSGGAGGADCGDIESTLFVTSCGQASCHSAETHAGSLDLVSGGVYARLLAQDATTSCAEAPLLVPADPESSVLYTKLTDSFCGPSRMPLGLPALSSSEIACVRDWIANGGAGGESSASSATSSSMSSAASTSGAGGAGGTGGAGGSGAGDLSYLNNQLCPTPVSGHPAGTQLFVAAGGTEGRITVTSDGVTWDPDQTTVSMGTIEPGHTRNLIRGLGYGGGVFVAVGGHDNSLIDTSCDGINWRRDVLGTNTNADPPSTLTAFISGVAYKDGVFVGVGAAGARFTSDDHGYSWTRVPVAAAEGHLRNVAAGNGIFVAVGESWNAADSALMTTSTDGINWTPVAESPNHLAEVVFGNGLFVTTGPDRCNYSSDGINWSDCTTLIHSVSNPGLSFANGTFYVQYLVAAGTHLSSTDAMTWTSADGWLPNVFAYGAGRYVRIGYTDRGYSTDFVNWMEIAQEGSDIGMIVFGDVLYDPP